MQFSLLPGSFPQTYARYKTCKPPALGRALTAGWELVASFSFDEFIEGQGQIHRTLFLIGKDPQRKVVTGPAPVLMYPQENTGESAEDLLERLASMTKREILALHEELLARRGDADDDDDDEQKVDEAPEEQTEPDDLDDEDDDDDLDDLDDDDDDEDDDEEDDQVAADMAELMAGTEDDDE